MKGVLQVRRLLVVRCLRTRSPCARCLLCLAMLTSLASLYLTVRNVTPTALSDFKQSKVVWIRAVNPAVLQRDSEERNQTKALSPSTTDYDDQHEELDLTYEQFNKVNEQFKPVDEQSNPKPSLLNENEVALRFVHRRQKLQTACERYANSSAFKKLNVEEFPVNLYKPAFNTSVGYCAIQKASSTTWKFIFNSIRRRMTGKGIVGIPPSVPFAHRDVLFAFVREPYARLLSAYVDKLFSPNAMFWRKTGRYIVENFRRNASSLSLQCGHDVTFPEFVRYFIRSQHTGLHRDGHFVPVHDHCRFCDFAYRYIGHLETIREDLPFLLKTMQSPIPYNTTPSYYSEGTVSFNTHRVLTLDRSDTERCMDFDQASRRLWKTFQMRGLISKRHKFPLTLNQTRNITEQELISAEVRALGEARDKGAVREQTREALREAFASVPMEERREVQRLLLLDCHMFGYDPQPQDVFPRRDFTPDPHFSYFDLYK